MEKIAIASKDSVPISRKSSVEISSFLRGRNTDKAKNILKRVIEKKEAIPFKRYKRDIAHKKGKMAAGKYPVKASKYFLELIELVESNARQKGLVSPFKIIHLLSNQGSKTWHYGKYRRRTAKRTHLEIKIQEIKKKEPEKKEMKKLEEKKEEPNKETVEKKQESKEIKEKIPTATELATKKTEKK